MDTIKNYIESIQRYLSQLSLQKKVFLAGSLGLLSIAAFIGFLFFKHDPYQTLYTDLPMEDSKAISKKLSDQNIPYRLSDDNSTVFVPSSQVANSRMQLAKEGLPGHDVVGFEKFDSTTLGMSSYVQKIQYVRAVQGELTRSIQRLAAVKRARVHISLPPKKVFMEEEEPPKSSVILELKPGQTPSKAEITGIAHLVASAVEGLKVSQVTIVDTKGNFLHRPDDQANPSLNSAIIELQKGLEVEYEKRIEDLLTPVVGLGKVRSKVTVEMDPSRTNTMEETYDPEKAVARNVVKNDEVTQGSRPNPIGIPGSRSNLPGAEVTNPQVPMANSSTEKNMQNTNYAIPRKVQTIDKPSGGIKRLTVAVLVDGYYTKGAQGEKDVFSPRSEEELKRLQDIVSNAVGFDSQRRDSINLSCLPFNTTNDVFAPEENLPITSVNQMKEWMPLIVKNLSIGLFIVLFFTFVLRPFLKWASVTDLQKEAQFLPKTVSELEAARVDDRILALNKAATQFSEMEPIEKKEEEELKKKILEKMDGAPKKGVRIVQDWLEAEQQQQASHESELIGVGA
jgi:flagellar M-ring protein FliF